MIRGSQIFSTFNFGYLILALTNQATSCSKVVHFDLNRITEWTDISFYKVEVAFNCVLLFCFAIFILSYEFVFIFYLIFFFVLGLF